MEQKPKGLLFHCSFDKSLDADYAAGSPEPTFAERARVITGGVSSGALECDNAVKLAWRAPGNIYAERGTLSFFWRSRYPAGKTEFPIFRVGFADHSSWDCVFLRIDYNGHGFEALVTDINLSRARVSCQYDISPPDTFMHFALSWDENYGIKFYINGKPVAEEERPAVYFAGLDQFGPHQRIVGNWNVISDYNYIRGGDFDELVIYDRMLSDENIAELAGCRFPKKIPEPDIRTEAHRKEWLLRNGFDAVLPAALPQSASVRKVEIHEAYDLKRWWWKGLDGIRETTWPGVHNRSSLKGRNDYFQLPDWDCYSISGKELALTMPDEPFNHIEISGSAFGSLTDGDGNELLRRPRGAERTVHRLGVRQGGRLKFINDKTEEPIGDFSVYNVSEGNAPSGRYCEEFYVVPHAEAATEAGRELTRFIEGRYLPYERQLASAVPADKNTARDIPAGGKSFPFVHILLEYTADDTRGLDGIELTLPPFNFSESATPFSVQIKDPLWYYRNLAHFTFTVKHGVQQKIWFDLRDRVLPENKCIYLTVACADFAFNAGTLFGAKVRLVYKPAGEAKAEHSLDRFTQVRDVYAHLVEEHPRLPQFNLFNRFYADITDLLKVDPEHVQGRYYYYLKMKLNKKYADGSEPEFNVAYKTETVPENTPAWAFKQVEFLRHYKYLVNWYIDNRQIETGEFGGGLSDDGDFTATWVGLAELGSGRDKVLASLIRCAEAFFEQGMFTNGLPSIQADELHSAEEGLISLGQVLTADFSNPKFLERCMETARSLFWLTGINSAGHRHIRSSYYSGSKLATEEPWGVQQSLSTLALSPAWFLVRYNGNVKLKRLMTELADGIMAHWHPETKSIQTYVRFEDDAELTPHNKRGGGERSLLVPAAMLTGENRYLEPLINTDRSVEHGEANCEDTEDKAEIAEAYEKQNELAGIAEYYNTEGHPWIDRVSINTLRLQQDRLGGVAHTRSSHTYPRNRISWRFTNGGDDERLAVLTPVALTDRLKLVVCNISDVPVTAEIIGSEILPGRWRISQGLDKDADDRAENAEAREAYWERSTGLSFKFEPRETTVITLELAEKGTAYWERCDLGIGADDIFRYAHGINVRVHSLGSAASPEAELALKDKNGKILRLENIRPLEAPADLYPRTWDVIFNLNGIDNCLDGAYFELDPFNRLCEITRANNVVKLV